MNEKDWKNLRAAAAISGGAVPHGITSKAWQWWHTFFTVLGAARDRSAGSDHRCARTVSLLDCWVS